MSTMVIYYIDVVHCAADMQTQVTESNDKDKVIIIQHKTILFDGIIKDEKNSSTFGVSK